MPVEQINEMEFCMSWCRTGVTFLGLVLSLPIAGHTQEQPPPVSLQEIYVVQNTEFSGRFPHAEVRSFDLSPDGKTVAVEFEVWEGEGLEAIWVALWDVEARRLQSAKRLEGPDREVGRFSQYGYQVRFSRDGSMLFVLTGPRLVALKLPDLEEHYTVEAPAARDDIPSRLFIYKFSIATPANRLALLYVYHRVYSATYEVKILDSKNGEVLQRWRGAGQAVNISLSAEGKRVAVSVVSGVARSDKNNVLIFDVSSGDLVRTLNPQYATGSLQFVGNGNQLATVARYHEVPEYYRTDTIKLWDVATGEVLKKLGYGEHGLRGALSASHNGALLAATAEWSNPSDIRWDRDDIRGFTRFLLWGLPGGKPLFISSDLPREMLSIMSEAKFLIRLSADGTRFAVGGELISVYQFAGRSCAD